MRCLGGPPCEFQTKATQASSQGPASVLGHPDRMQGQAASSVRDSQTREDRKGRMQTFVPKGNGCCWQTGVFSSAFKAHQVKQTQDEPPGELLV